MKNFLLIFILLLAIVLPFTVSAYYESPGPGDLRSNVYPSNPGVNQKTSITLGSYILNLDSCNILWKQDGKQIDQGIGKKFLSFTTGKLGQVVSISATLSCTGRDQITKNWQFQVNDVDFLVTADTYTPPFYKGNSRITPKSSVKIIAMPQVFSSTGELIEDEFLVYKWTKNGKAMPISSGYGKKSITIQANELPGSTSYAVEISSPSGEIKAFKSTTVRVEDPKIIFYENKPLLGLQYQKGQGKSLTLTENETTLAAEPFFFANADITNGKLIFNWSMNSKEIPPNDNGRSINLRQNAGQTGEATIGLQVSNDTNFFSAAKKSLQVNFGQKTSLFGF